jgi:hypothetical protein
MAWEKITVGNAGMKRELKHHPLSSGCAYAIVTKLY